MAEIAAQGLHLEGFDFPALYRFRPGELAEFVYRLDYPTVMKKDRESYLQLFEDAGLEHVGDMGGWVNFRKQIQPGDPTELFTDVESKMKKCCRVKIFLIILLPVWIAGRPDFDPESMTLLKKVILLLHTLCMLLWAAALFTPGQTIKQLQGSV